MLNRASLLTFAAVATLALAALAPATASAKGGHGGGHGGGMHSSHMKGGHGHHFNRNHWRQRHVRWHRHYNFRYVKRVLPVYSTYSVARPAAPSCTCLTKTYLENGAVLFQDVCTKESASNQPADEQAQAQ